MTRRRDDPPGWYRLAGWSIPLAFVLVFLKVEFQPTLAFHGASVAPADAAIILAVVCALLVLRREGLAPLARSWPLWLSVLAFLAFVTAASLYPRLSDSDYAWKTHLITAVKFAEYALLAPATAVLVRDRVALRRLGATVVGLTVAAAVVGVLQFVGVEIFRAWPSGNREPSFAGFPELAALGCSAIAIGLIGLLWPGSVGRRVLVAALVAGAVALVLSGAVEGGIALAAIAIAAPLVRWRHGRLGRRGLATIAGVTAVCAIGLLGLRGGDIAGFGRDIGVLSPTRASLKDVNTYSQRELMSYIALKVFERHVLLGAGWQSIREQHVYAPVLPAARRAFPSEPAQAFPAPDHTWSVDDAYLQSLAELGLLGTALFLTMLVTGVWVGTTTSLRAAGGRPPVALLGLLWLLISIGIWAGQGLVAGIAFEALPFIAIGLIAAARAVPGGAAEVALP